MASARPASVSLPAPSVSGIDHVVVLMMENRSFDHYLGWLPGSDGRQAGLQYPDPAGQLHATYHLATYQGCGSNDPDHSYQGGRVELNGGTCDGWLLDTANDIFCIGYYQASDLAFFSHAAPYWTTCDHYFAATMAPTYPNRFYMHAAQTDRTDDSTTVSALPTIWDSLAAAGVSHAYYFSDVPFTALWGAKYAPISQPVASFLAACAAGTLPAVSFVDPRFEDEGSGTSGDDHPHADIRVGQSFINEVYQAITSSPAWERTVFVINYDEWGGFFDHVAPATAPDASPANGLRGFRVPALVISPLARRGTVAHHTYDHASVLKMIEWRWGLPALTPRDAAARNIAEVLNFSGAPDLTAPRWNVPAVVPQACPATAAPAPAPAPTEHELTWAAVASLARASGFTLPLPGAPGLQCRDELLDFSYAPLSGAPGRLRLHSCPAWDIYWICRGELTRGWRGGDLWQDRTVHLAMPHDRHAAPRAEHKLSGNGAGARHVKSLDPARQPEHDQHMEIRIQCLCIDTADPARIASFWQAALGWRRTFEDEDQVCLEPPEGSPEDGISPDLVFLKVPEGKTAKNRLHLDLRPADQPAEVTRLEALGARRASIGQGDVSWVVMADPDGNEFDVLAPLAPDELPPGHDALGRRITAGTRP